ncbi:unnamed protein product, partial [Cladocopium goreaui]
MASSHRVTLFALLALAFCRTCFVGLSLSPLSPLSRRVASLPRAAAPGPPLTLTEENVEVVLQEARYHHLQNCFGYVEESSGAGITGKVDLVEVEGPMVFIHLYGAFWHNRADVLRRVKKYLMQRIPEIAEVDVSDPEDLIDEGRDRSGKFYHCDLDARCSQSVWASDTPRHRTPAAKTAIEPLANLVWRSASERRSAAAFQANRREPVSEVQAADLLNQAHLMSLSSISPQHSQLQRSMMEPLDH